MAKNRIFDLIFLPTEAYDLFDMLDNVKGQSDITSYEQNVCKHYTDFITHALQTYELPFQVAIFDKASLNIGLRQYDKLLDLIVLVDKSLGKGLNFNRLELSLPEHALGEAEFDEWLNMAIASTQSLPKAKMVFGNNAYDTIGRVLFGKKDFDFSLPQEMITEMDKWCNAKICLGDNAEEYVASRSMLNSIPDKWKTLFEALSSSSDPYTDSTILNKAHSFADKFVAKYPTAMIAVDDIVTLLLEEYRESISISYEIESKKHAKKTASFWTGFGIWAVLMGVLAYFLFVNRPIILPLNEFIENGFFENVGLTLACLGVLIVITLIFGSFGCSDAISSFFAAAPVIPRGASLMFCCYLVFASDYPEMVGDYIIPFYVFGIVCVIVSFFYEIMDVFEISGESHIVNKWRSNLRGSVMYSTPLAILPPIMLIAFIWTFTFLHIVAVWIVMILAIISITVMIWLAITGTNL